MKVFDFDKDDMRQDIKQEHLIDKFFRYMNKPCFRKLKNFDYPESSDRRLNEHMMLQMRNVVFNWISGMSHCHKCGNDLDPFIIQLLGFDRCYYFHRNEKNVKLRDMNSNLEYNYTMEDVEVIPSTPFSDIGHNVFIIVLSRCLWCKIQIYSGACLDKEGNIEKLKKIIDLYRYSPKLFGGFMTMN